MAHVFAPFSRKVTNLLLLSCVSFATNTKAEDSANADEHSTIEPSIGIELLFDDNIFLSPTDTQSSLITTLTPGLLAILVPSKHRFELEYSGEFATYADSGADNYSDHDFRAEANLEIGLRSQLELVGNYADSHQNRGTGLTEGFDPESGLLPDEPDVYNSTSVLGRFTYGSSGAKGRLVFAAGHRALEYKNNRQRTRFFDYEIPHGGMTLYVRVMPSTSLLLDVRTAEYIYRYDRPSQPSLESNEQRYLLGVTWDVTGKTIGTVKVGFVEKDYDDSRRGRFAEASWEVDIRWLPRSNSYFDFSTSRYPSEVTSLAGDVIDNKRYDIAWSHAWNDRVLTRLAFGYADQDFRGSSGVRVQKLKRAGLTLDYTMRRWLTWELGLNVSAQEGNDDRYDFDNNMIWLGANFVF